MTRLRLDGRVIAMTGIGAPLGAAIARELGGLGAVVVDDAQTDGDPAALVREAMARHGRLDAIVAADLGSGVQDCVDRHLLGTIAFVEAALAVMDPASAARIVAFTSGAGLFGSAAQPLPAATAAGVCGYVRSIALATRDTRIRANLISTVVGTSPHLDACAARSIAPAVAFLCHPQCELGGELWSAGHGRFATVFSSTVPGHFEPEADIDDIAAHLDEIRARDHAVIPRRAEDEGLLIDV